MSEFEREPDGVSRDGAAETLGDVFARPTAMPIERSALDAGSADAERPLAEAEHILRGAGSLRASEASASSPPPARADEQSHALYGLLEDLTGAAGWVMEAGSTIVTPTNGLRRMLQLEPEGEDAIRGLASARPLAATELLESIAAPDRLRSLVVLRRTLRTGAPARFELTTVPARGGARLEISAARYRLENGAALVGVAIDVSERYRLIGDLSHAARQALETVETVETRLPPAPVSAITHRMTAFGADDVDALAQVAAHDFQGKIRKILFYADLVKRGYSCSDGAGPADVATGIQDEIPGFVDKIMSSAMAIREQISDLAYYADIVSAPLNRQDVMVSDLVHATIERMDADLSACGAAVVHEGDVLVHADPDLLTNALSHLIENAVRFRGPTRPEIRISARKLPQGEAESGWSRITVADNGAGFDPAQGDRIFDLFTRLATPSGALDAAPALQTRNQARSSTGIGLAICSSVARRHGGRIWAQTSPGQGASFHMDLPGSPTF